MSEEHIEYYRPLSEVELKSTWKKHKDFIESFISSNKYDGSKVYVNEDVILSIIVKVDQRRKYFKFFHGIDMSEYKEAALNSFWYIKLHPLNIESRELAKHPPKVYDSINEKLALYIILKTLRAMLETNKMSTQRLDELPQKYIDELIYSFTYRDISKESLILLTESMAIFLELDPYANKTK